MKTILLPLLINLSLPTFALTLSSPAFLPNTPIPVQYTCKGADHSPALAWQDAPTHTQSYAIILHDPDAPAGNWVHWLVFNLPSTLQQLPEQASLPTGALSGQNSWGSTGYRGPCPPSGTHRYVLTLYALDNRLTLPTGANVQALMQAMQGHILAQTTLMSPFP